MSVLTEAEVKALREKLAAEKSATLAETLAQADRALVGGELAYGEIAKSREFAKLYVDRFRYVPEWRRWLAWDGKRWAQDGAGAARLACKELCDQTARDARADSLLGKDPASRERMAQKYEARHYVDAVLDLACVEPALVTSSDRLDQDEMLFNTPGGTVDLRTGQMRPHSRADMLTLVSKVAPAPGPTPTFDRFLREITLGDDELVGYLQQALGSCLSGAISDHWLMFWHGQGRNGKNTLGDLVLDIFGGYGRKVPAQTLLADQHGNRHPTEVANLRGIRLAVSSEVSDGDRWHEARIKEVTGDATLSARYMRADFFEFRRTHKHLIYGNHRPLLNLVDHATAERLHLVPFLATFEGKNLDPQMSAKLAVESGQILSWLIDGHARWMARGRLFRSAAVESATDEYLAAQSTVEMWVGERCLKVDDDGRGARQWPKSSEMYADYATWKKDRGENALSNVRFSEQLQRLFVIRAADGKRVVGVELLPRGIAPW